MPKSKRNRIVHTSSTKRDRKALTRRLHSNIQSAASEYKRIYVFSVHNMRNTFIKNLRAELADSRIFMGKTKLMAHALGTNEETEFLKGVSGLSGHLKGEVGLLFSDREEADVQALFEGFVAQDYARAGVVAGDKFVIPRGVTLTTRYGVPGGEDDPLPLAIEPRLRQLGVPTRIVKGKVVLEDIADHGMDEDGDEDGYVVCREGDVLESRQTEILKIFGMRMAEFRVVLMAAYDKTTEQVTDIGEMDVDGDTG